MNCRQGDLAIIIRSPYANNGKLVRVEDTELCEPGEWRCTSLCTLTSLVVDSGQLIQVPPGGEAWLYDEDLWPLPGVIDEKIIKLEEIA
jgi:hypothetical protein